MWARLMAALRSMGAEAIISLAILWPQAGQMMANVRHASASTNLSSFGFLVCMEDRPMTIEYAAVAIGAFLIVAIMIWKRLRFINARLMKIQNELNELRTIASRLFIMALNANSKVETSKTEPNKGPPQSNGGEVVAEKHTPQSPDPEAGTSLVERHELCAELITLVPPAEVAPQPSEQDAERPVDRIEGRRLLQAWPLQR
jgi:hypothetical protein